ncbi:uncharacterized protein LOC143275014 isoform X2 [Babylonia areolata]|uniref:uncharacterized protein LOC143275014 isoform X2 n=1 Tax=Babylonia areolata TaxID=304850 RepID=UPI003FD5FC23
MGLRPRNFPEYPYPPRADHHWLSSIPDTSYSWQYPVSHRSRIYPSYCPPYQHLNPPLAGHPAHSALTRKLKPSIPMDYVPSPESFYASEMAQSAFAASPNSLYMYDQERHDIQNTLNNGILGQTCAGSDVAMVNAEPEFDLNPQYENNSLEGYLGGMWTDSMLPGTSEGCLNTLSTICSEKQRSSEFGFLQTMRSDLKQEGPTLAELNMDPFLIEDIYSIIGEEENVQASSTVKQVVSGTRKHSTATQPVKTETVTKSSPVSCLHTAMPPVAQTLSQSQVLPATSSVTSVFGSKLQNVAVVPPISVTAATIKTEPVDTYDDTGSKSCLHKMLSSPPLRPVLSPAAPMQTSSPPRQVMPVVGQSRAPSLAQQPIKSESVEEKWKEIEKFIHDPELAPNRKRKRYASGSSAIMSDEEDFKRQTDNMSDDDYDDSDSDVDSDFSDSPLEESLTELAKKSKQYFWQYNVQAKGPKGTRLKLQINDADPHHPSTFEDPVFDANSTSLVGIRHGGKARKGDGNEVTPNPRKLCQIGQQLYKLNRQINNCQVSHDLPAHIRNKSRKEKNKLASRACRLKKKAQHEANKIKLTGLDSEQNELLDIIHVIWPQLKERAQQRMEGVIPSGAKQSLTAQLEEIINTQHKMLIAGKTTDYVNDVIKKVEEGDPCGGLPIRSRVKK